MEEVSYPETDEINPDFARFLFEKHCAILVVENLPVGSEFGIDMVAYRVGEKFKGVKLIPPGIHFIYASAVERNSYKCAPRSGFFYNFKPRELIVRHWSISNEEFELCDNIISEEQIYRYKSNLRELDQFLGAYRYSTYRTYIGLTNKFKADLIETLIPDCKQIRSVPYLTRDSASSDEPSNKRQVRVTSSNHGFSGSKPTEESLLPDLKPDPSTVIHFTKIPNDHIESGQTISSSMITQYSLDTTMKLDHSFDGDTGRSRLLGEFQFAFVTFLLCHHYDCFEHWKKLLRLVCLADNGLISYPRFFVDFTKILEAQIGQIPEDLFDDIVDDNNLVRYLLDIFFQNITANPNTELIQSMIRLKRLVQDKFNWQFDLEREDEQPIVVEL